VSALSNAGMVLLYSAFSELFRGLTLEANDEQPAISGPLGTEDFE